MAARGPAVLLSHGYSATGRMWDGQRAALGDRWRIISWDMRGHGQTESPNDPRQYSAAAGPSPTCARCSSTAASRAR